MGNKITLKNISNFIEGNVRMSLDGLDILEDHIAEQVNYRIAICKDTCGTKGKCQHCGCGYPGRLYSSPSCNNGELFPDMMGKEEWEQFKIDKEIE